LIRLLHRLCLGLGLIVTVRAQEGQPELLHLAVAGPATLRSRLLPTDLGSMCSSAEAVAIWATYVEQLDAALRASRVDAEAFAEDRARFLGYAGTFHLVVWLEQEEDGVHVPRWSAGLIAEPDARTDLVAMARGCEQWLARLGARTDKAWRELEVSTPRVHNGRLLIVLGSAEDRAAATARAEQFVPLPLPRNEVAHLDIQVQRCLLLLRDRNWERGLVGDLVGSGLERASCAIGSKGPNVACSLGLNFGNGPRGLLGSLWPPRTGVPDLDWLVPADTATRFAWRVDTEGLWNTWVGVLAGAFERTEKVVRSDLERRFCMDAQRDVFAHLRGDALLLWRAVNRAEDEGDHDALPFANACLVLPVRNQDALVAGASKLLKAIGAVPDVDGDDVFYGQWAGLGHVAIGHGVACLAFGERGRDHVDAVLELASGRPLPADAATIEGEGTAGRGRVDVSALMVRDVYAQLRLAAAIFGAGDFAPEVRTVAVEALRWQPLLKTNGLESASAELRWSRGEAGLLVLW
jgi:hypothetical protein